MAVITINFNELKKLTKADKNKIIETLPLLGVPIEINEENKDEWTLEITPNRPDLLCIQGIARLLNSYFYKKNNMYISENENYSLKINENVKNIRPYIALAVVKNLNITEEILISLMQIQEKLHTTIGRKRKKVAIGIHDLKNINFPLTYEGFETKNSPEFIPLEKSKLMNAEQVLKLHEKGISYANLVNNNCVFIMDKEKKVLSFPPIINSELTKVTENTKDVLIDVTGTHKETVEEVLNILVCTLSDMGGKIINVKIGKETYPKLQMRKMKIPSKKIEKILGIKLTKKQINEYLEKMGFIIQSENLLIPPYRVDILGEIDVIEDIAIAMDYNSIDSELPDFFSIGEKKQEHISHSILTGLGFNEVFTWTLTNKEKIEKTNLNFNGYVEIENPLTKDFTIIRPSILPNLLDVFAESKKEKMPQNIYELGITADPELKTKLAGAMTNSKIGFTEIRSVIQALLNSLEGKYEIKPSENKMFILGRCAAIWDKNKKIGIFGEVHPQIILDFGLECPVVAFELII